MTSLTFSQQLAQTYFESSEKFPIDFDDAWVWLGYSRKDNGKSKFVKCGFVEGLDFRFLKVKETRQDGSFSHYVEKLFLTCECLKQWAMMAGTEKGKEVRLYFLECERIAKDKLNSMTTADLLVQMALAYKEHEVRLSKIEIENIELKKQLAEVKENQEVIELETQANTCELERFRNGHGYWYSIIGYANKLGNKDISLKNASSLGRKASALCKLKGIVPEKINDPRFGTVQSYPEYILMEIM